MTKKEAASYLNITPGTLARLTRANKIPGAIKKGFVSFYRESFLVAWIEGRPLPVDPPPPPPTPVTETDLLVLKAAQESDVAVDASSGKGRNQLAELLAWENLVGLADEVPRTTITPLREKGRSCSLLLPALYFANIACSTEAK